MMGNEQAGQPARCQAPRHKLRRVALPPSRRYPRASQSLASQGKQPNGDRNEQTRRARLPACLSVLYQEAVHHSELGEVGWCYGGGMRVEEEGRLGWKGGNGTARRGLKRTGGEKMLARSSGEWKATKARWGGELDALLLPPLEGKSLSLFSHPNLCGFIYMPHTHMGDGDTHTMSSSLVYLLWN